MKIYTYDNEGYLTSIIETTATDYEMPINSTLVEIPIITELQTCKFNGDEWMVVDRPIIIKQEQQVTDSERITATEEAINMLITMSMM